MRKLFGFVAFVGLLFLQQVIFTQPVSAALYQGCKGGFETVEFNDDFLDGQGAVFSDEFITGDQIIKVTLFDCNPDEGNTDYSGTEYYWTGSTRDNGEYEGYYEFVKRDVGSQLLLPEPIDRNIQSETEFDTSRYQEITRYNMNGIVTVTPPEVITVYSADVFQGYIENDTIDQAGTGGSATQGDEDTTFSCAGEAGPLGWILCPLANGMLDALDNLAGDELQGLLQINANVVDGEEFQSAVDNFRTFANILLVIGFLVIIFAQAMSLGIDAYTIKRTLPRLALAVIAIQLSTPIAQVLIDLFNVIGLGIADLILSTVGDESISLNFNPLSANSDTFLEDSFSWVAQGVGATALAASIGSAIWALVLALPTILIVVVITVAMLVVRRMVLIALILVAPLAMAAWILPNTEKWAKEWFDTFIKILLMFPLIIGLIAMGKFLASVNTIAVDSGESLTFIDSLVTLLAAFGPYLLIPFTYQFAGRLFGALGQMAGKLQGRALNGGGGKSSAGGTGGLTGAWQNRMNRKRTQMAAGQTRFTKNNNKISSALRRGSAPGLNVPGAGLKDSKTLKRLKEQGGITGALAGATQALGTPGKRSQVRADDVAREANDALVQEGLKELEKRNISGSKEALRGLSFGMDAAGQKEYERYRDGVDDYEGLSEEDAATADFYREQYGERLRSNPALVQAAQLQRASLGDMVTEHDYGAALKGVSGTSQLKRQHVDAMVGASMGAGVHRVMGLNTDGSSVSFNQANLNEAVATRTGEQLIRTNKNGKNVKSTVKALTANLNSDKHKQNTASQIATILTSDTVTPKLRTAVQNEVYSAADPEEKNLIDQFMGQAKRGEPVDASPGSTINPDNS